MGKPHIRDTGLKDIDDYPLFEDLKQGSFFRVCEDKREYLSFRTITETPERCPGNHQEYEGAQEHLDRQRPYFPTGPIATFPQEKIRTNPKQIKREYQKKDR